METRIIGAILTLRGHRTNPTKSDRKENNEYKTIKEVILMEMRITLLS